MRRIAFSPPALTEEDIQAAVEVLRSGWITTGPVHEEFCRMLCAYTGGVAALGLNSATAGLFLALKVLGIGEGDEVITTPYTFAATANAVLHTGARVVFADTVEGSFFMSPKDAARKMNPRTKAVIPVDFGGGLPDYEAFSALLRTSPFKPANALQEMLGRPLLLADSAHSLGVPSSQPDIRIYSFHAVKNLTTAEGGMLVCGPSAGGDFVSSFMKALKLYALHGQDRSARDKFASGSWEYDILLPGYKFNLPDVLAALGLSQLRRYESGILPHRRRIFDLYLNHLSGGCFIAPELGGAHSAHLFPLRLQGWGKEKRNRLICRLAEAGISANVHYKPLTLMSAASFYGKQACPCAENQWINEISLPIHGGMSEDDALFVAEMLKSLAL